MTTIKLFVTTLVASIVLSGCGASTIGDRLSVTKNIGIGTLFEEEKPETPPIDVSWNVVASPATIVTDATGRKKGSAARISGRAVLVTANHKVPDRYKITWTGQRKTHAAEPTVIALRDQSGDRALELRFEGDRLRVITATEDEFPRLTFSNRKQHDVTVYLNMSSRPTIEVNIAEGKIPIYTTPPIELMNADFRSLDEVEINVSSDTARYDISKFIAVADDV